MKKLFILTFFLLAAGCNFSPTPPEANNPTESPTVRQGLYGKITLITGNCMPSVGTRTECKTSSVSRAVYIREPVTMKSMDTVYLKDKTSLVKQTKSNNSGFYQVDLSPGTYSIFVEDNGKEYCSLSTGQKEMCLITVGNGLTKYDIKINHAAF